MGKFDLLVIVASTGGPKAIEEVCRGFTSEFKVPILIVQHLPNEYTSGFIKYLNKHCQLKVKEIKDQEPIVPGKILIAPGGYHIKVAEMIHGDKVVGVDKASYTMQGIKPSADILFNSIARVFKNERILAVVLTGIGRDGTVGIRKLKEAGLCYCLSQDEKSSTVFGMPKSVINAGLSDEVINLSEMSKRITQIVS